MRKFGLIGKKLLHSFSKLYFDNKFREENIADSEYSLYEINDSSEILNIVDEDDDIVGLNVTNPFKRTVVELLDDISDEANAIGAVNTIKIERSNCGKRLIGYNTDSCGFLKTIKKFTFRKAMVLGSGGAAAAVCHALKQMAVETVVVSRNEGFDLTYDMLDKDTIESVDLIVNCTPLGTFPDVDSFPPIPYHYLTEKHFLYDLVYNPDETVFLREGGKYTACVKNGLEMLYNQADASWRIWTNSHF